MSRSNNTEVFNPAKRFYEWVGSKGVLKYYDKESKKEIFVPLPFSFLVLDRLHKITGFNERQQASFYSNEVRDIRKNSFTVRTKNGIVATGLYGSLASTLNQGAQYAQSVYIACKNADNKLELCNLSFTGSAIGPWIELCKGKDVYKYVVTISGKRPMQKGTTNYFAPIMKLSPNITPETEATCQAMDKELQNYLKIYFSRSLAEQQENITPADTVTDKQRQDIKDLPPPDQIDDINSQLENDAAQHSLFEGGATGFDPIDSSDDLPF